MKIFYVSVIEQHAGWGAEYFVNRGFVNGGHATLTLDYREHRNDLCRHFLALAQEDFDAMLLQRGDWFPIELLQAVQRPRFFWASELVSRNDDQDRLLSSGLFQHIFVHSTECRNAVVGNGWAAEEAVSVLLNGFDETVHYPMPQMEKDIDVLFLGNLTPRREAWLARLQQSVRVTTVNAFGADMTRYFNRAKIVLNIHAEDFLDTETRVFEALGCGAFLLTETLSQDNPFQDRVHLVEVADVEEMVLAIKHYLDCQPERVAVAAEGHREAMVRHSYSKRAESIAGLFQGYLVPKAGAAVDAEQVLRFAPRETALRRRAGVERFWGASIAAVAARLALVRRHLSTKARNNIKGAGT